MTGQRVALIKDWENNTGSTDWENRDMIEKLSRTWREGVIIT